MAAIWTIIPDGKTLLALPPQELAEAVLQALNSQVDAEMQRLPHQAPPTFHLGNFVNPIVEDASRHLYRDCSSTEIVRAIEEAWSWLVVAGLLAPAGHVNPAGFYFVTRCGRKIRSSDDFAAYRTATRLPRELLHPQLQERPWLSFVSGDYDTAVFQAFKLVEVAVREAGGFGAGNIGVPLMRTAFDATNGPLTKRTDEPGEREGLSHLFAGGIASYKNPHSHRTVSLKDPLDAIEMLMLASHLLRIVDDRDPRRGKAGGAA